MTPSGYREGHKESDSRSRRNLLVRLKRAYGSGALILLNVVSLVAFLNLALASVYIATDAFSSDEVDGRLFREDGAPARAAKRTKLQLQWSDFTAYEGASPKYVGQVLDNFYDLEQLGFVYQAWVQFAEPPFRSQHVNVYMDQTGSPVRKSTSHMRQAEGGGVEDRVVRIFTLGGSTTFGYNVSDAHTWPSFLLEILNRRAEEERYPYRVEVINYGRGYYHPTQEVALLADLLRSGHRPSLVIFMDGVNWGGIKDTPQFNPEVAKAFSARQHGREIRPADIYSNFGWVPMIRFTWSLNRWLNERLGPKDDVGAERSRAKLEDQRMGYSLDRFEQSRRLAEAICELYGCSTLFFLQPSVFYRYNLELYRTELPESFTSRLDPTRNFYETMRQKGGYIDLSHLFEEWGEDRKAIVDDVHYSPGFGRFVAQHVAGQIDFDELPVFPEVIDESSATGAPRSIVLRGEWVKAPGVRK